MSSLLIKAHAQEIAVHPRHASSPPPSIGRLHGLLGVLVIMALPTGALAQQNLEPLEEAPDKAASNSMKTAHPDAFYGSAQSAELQVALPGSSLDVAAVDRRDEVDPLAIQGSLFPTAHIPKTHRFIYRNQMLFGQQLSMRASDKLLINATWFISPGSLGSNAGGDFDRRLGLSARRTIYQRGDLNIALQAGVQQQKGLYKRDTKVFNGQLSAQLDYKVSDTVVLGAGVMGNMPMRLTYTDFDLSECTSRQEFSDETCINYESFSEGFPPGGRFVLGWVGVTYYGPSNLYLKTEAFSGIRRGTILGLEGALYNDESLEAQLGRYRTTEASFGVINGAPLALSVSTGYTYKRVALQVTLLMIPGALPEVDNRDDGTVGIPPHIFPMMTLGVAF